MKPNSESVESSSRPHHTLIHIAIHFNIINLYTTRSPKRNLRLRLSNLLVFPVLISCMLQAQLTLSSLNSDCVTRSLKYEYEVESTVFQCFSAWGAHASYGLSLGIFQPVLISHFPENMSGLCYSTQGGAFLRRSFAERAYYRCCVILQMMSHSVW
jgi:hypothetical protein